MEPRSRRATGIVIGVLVAASLAGCSSIAPTPVPSSLTTGLTTTPTTPTITASPTGTAFASIARASEVPVETPAETLTSGGPEPRPFRSPAFEAGGGTHFIPRKFTCDGQDVSPPLDWTGTFPDGTAAEWAIVVDDPDANGFIHWVVAGIPGDVTSLPEGAGTPSTSGYSQGPNSFGTTGYRGPCPPSGRAHHYVFSLYGFASPPGLAAHPSAEQVRKAAGDRAKATTTAEYSR